MDTSRLLRRCRPRDPLGRTRGFTLIELLYAVALAGFIVAIGVPSFLDTIRNSRMNAATNTLLASLHVARSEAVKQRARVTVCRSTVSASPACDTSGIGYAVFLNTADDQTIDTGAGDTVLRTGVWLQSDITVTFSSLPNYVSYASTGFTRSIGGGTLSGDIVFCDARGDGFAKILRVPASGRPQILDHSDVTGAASCDTD